VYANIREGFCREGHQTILDVSVKFDMYGNLQRYRVVLPAIARLSCYRVVQHKILTAM